MYHSILQDAKTYELLQRVDEDLAAARRGEGCDCGGRLDRADYPRKSRGVAPAGEAAVAKRLSFCCAVDGCRQRATPESVRFLGRRVYLGAVIVVVTTMRHGATAARLGELRELFGVDARTVARWRAWWLALPTTRWWTGIAGRFMPPVDAGVLPGALLERMRGGVFDRLLALLRLMRPLTVSDGRRAPAEDAE